MTDTVSEGLAGPAAAFPIPSDTQAATFAITPPGAYALAPGAVRTQTAGTAIQATVAAGRTTIDIAGSLIGTASGARAIRAGLADGQIGVGADGVVQALDADAIQAQSATGRLDVMNAGSILSATSNTGVTASGPAPAAAAYALNFNASLGIAGAAADDFTSGGVIVNEAAALIRGDSGDAIRLGAHETLVNHGTIAGAGPINDSSNNNAFNGTSTAQRYDISRGVRINAATATNDMIENSGLIEGAQHGVDIGNTAATHIVVNNAAGASIIGHNGSGVGADTAGTDAGTVVVTNAGLIRGDYAPAFDRAGLATTDGDGDGVDVDGGATVFNLAGGTIAATGAGGFDSNGRANRSEGLSLGGGVVRNDGTISGTDSAIMVNNDSNPDGSRSGVLATSIVNGATGVIDGQNGPAIRLENKTGIAATDNDMIVNEGIITGGGTIPAGTVLREDGRPDPGTSGTLDGITYGAADAGNARFISGDGAAVQTGEGSDTLLNYGTITGATGRAVSLEGGDDLIVLHAGGTVAGRIDGGAGLDMLRVATDDRGVADGGTGATAGMLDDITGIEMLDVAGGSWTVADAQAYAAGIVVAADASLTVGAAGTLSGAVAVAGTLGFVHAGDLTFAGAITGTGAVVQAGTGTLTLSGAGSYFGGTTLRSGTLDVAARGATGSGPITFTQGSQTLAIEAAALDADGRFANTVTGLGTDGDVLDLRGIGPASAATLDQASGLLTLRDGTGGMLASLRLQGDFAGTTFAIAPDGTGGSSVSLRAAGVAPAPLNIVLTNDDGYDAPGLQTLYAALVSAGLQVHIVAPAANQSAQGSSLGGTAALSGMAGVTAFSPGNFYVDGRPATAALAALDTLFADNPPDLVISGTNRGENIGQSENVSGTVNGALQAVFEGVPAIAISAGSFNGSYDAAFANSANFMVDFLDRLAATRAASSPVLPKGEALSINVPGNPVLAGVTVTTTTGESTAAYPYAPSGPGTYAEGYVPNTAPSGAATSEGSQFLSNQITVTPLDGNWGATGAERDALAVRLGNTPSGTVPATRGLNILLVNEDGIDAPGLAATRDALLARGDRVTVLAPTADQSGTGSALTLSALTVTQYDPASYAANGTPASLVALALDPQGLFGGARPDLVVVGADRGDAVGIENANHSATLGGAITALFNYGVPSIALSSASGSAADLATGAGFLATLIGNLQATQGSAAALLPEGVGISINVPTGADAARYAFTTIDGGTDADLGAVASPGGVRLAYGGAVAGTSPTSEGDAFRAGRITVSPIDGSTAIRASAPYDALAQLVGTTYGSPSAPPSTLSFQVSEDAYQGDAQFLVTVNGHQIGGVQTATASHATGGSQTVTLLDFFDTGISQVGVQFVNDRYDGTPTTDRNLFVDSLTLNGAVYGGENAEIGAGAARLPTEAVLLGNGSISFATQDTLVLRVAEDAYAGDAQFLVTVDGRQAGGVQTVTAAHADGTYQDVTLTGALGDAHEVSVRFINDRYDGTPATDRNLFVQSASLNGQVYGPGVFAPGSSGLQLGSEAVLLGNGGLSFSR